MTSNVLPLFWHLSSTSKETRLDASEQLVSSLQTFQNDFHSSHPSTSASGSRHSNGNNSHATAAQRQGNEQDSDESGVEVNDDDESGDDAMEGLAENDLDEEIRMMDLAFDKSNSEDVKYSIKRLIRGLGSSRESSRLGFAVALTEIITQLRASSTPESISPSHILSLILRFSTTSVGQKGTEERDLLFARLFGLNALIDSGILTSSGSSSSANTWRTVVFQLILLGEKKAWMRESCWWSIIKAVRGLYEPNGEEPTILWREDVIQSLVERVYVEVPEVDVQSGKKARVSGTAKGLPWTQEKVALTLVLEELIVSTEWTELLAPTFRYPGILSPPNLSALGKILKETDTSTSDNAEPSGAPSSGGTGGTGTWKPQVHFVWDVIFRSYFPEMGSTSSKEGELPVKRASFQEFFRVVVDETLLAPSSSPSRKFWGFEIFSKALPLLQSEDVPLAFTKNFMKVWMGHLSGEEKLLHKAAMKITKQIQEVTKNNPLIGFTLLSQLLGKNGSHNFDRLTKTKTVEGIMSGLNAEGVVQYVQYLKDVVNQRGVETDQLDVAELESRRSWVFEQLLSLLRNPSISKEDSTIWSILEFLLLHGFFVLVKSNKKSNISSLTVSPLPAISEKLSAESRQRFFSAVIEATVQTRVVNKDPGIRTKRQPGCDTTGALWMNRCLELVAQLEGDVKHASAAVDVDDLIVQARQAARGTLSRLQAPGLLPRQVAFGIEILLGFTLLRTYDDDTSSFEMLEDVNRCAVQMLDKENVDDLGEDLPPIDLLVDVLIQYLDKASSDYRALASMVFGMISGEATISTVEHLIAQLEEVPGAEDDMSESDDDTDASGDDSEAIKGPGEDSSDEDTGDDDAEDEEDLSGTNVDPEFRRKIAEALQVAGMADNGRPDVLEDSDDEETDNSDDETDSFAMDDDQMLALDDKLAEIFKQQKAGAESKKGRGSTEAVHFKARVLDLIDVFIKKQAASPLLFSYILPLLRLAAEPAVSEKQLAAKATSILRDRFANAKDVPSIADAETVEGVLSDVHLAARTAGTKELSALCSQCSIFIVKAFHHMPSTSVPTGSGHPKAVTNVYRASLKEFMTRKSSRLHASFFLDLINRQPLLAWTLRDDLVRYARGEDGVNEHHQAAAIDLMSALAKQVSVIVKTHSAVEVEAWIASCRTTLYNTLESAGLPDGTLQAPRVKDVLKAVIQICRFSKAIVGDSESIAELWAVRDLETIGVALSNKFKDTKSVGTLFSQLELLISPTAQASQIQKKQEKADLKRKRQEGKAESKGEVNAAEEGKVKAKQPKLTKGHKQGKPKRKAERDVEMMDLDM